MDELLIKGITIGLPTWLLFLRVNATSKTDNAAVSYALNQLGKPFGIIGGLAFLVMIGLLANIVSKFCLHGLLIRFYQKRRASESQESLLVEIDRWRISQALKIQLKWVVIHNQIRWHPPFDRLFDRGFILTIALTLFLSLLGYIGSENQIVELISHFKVQYLTIASIAFFYFSFKHRNVWIGVSVLCILINLVEVVPWYLSDRSETPDIQFYQPTRVLLSNVWGKNKHYDKVIALARKEQPDIAVFLEAKNTWAKELEVLKDILPYVQVSQGVALYSKQPLENASTQFFVPKRPTIIADMTLDGQVISIVATHPNVPTRSQSFKSRNHQLAAIAHHVAKLENSAIVVGDLNITMWSPYYKSMVKTANLKNTRVGFGILPTWPTTLPFIFIPIDHCLVTPDIKVINIRTGPNVGSDHLPVIADLMIPKR